MLISLGRCAHSGCSQDGTVIRYRVVSNEPNALVVIGEWWCPLHDPGLKGEPPAMWRDILA